MIQQAAGKGFPQQAPVTRGPQGRHADILQALGRPLAIAGGIQQQIARRRAGMDTATVMPAGKRRQGACRRDRPQAQGDLRRMGQGQCQTHGRFLGIGREDLRPDLHVPLPFGLQTGAHAPDHGFQAAGHQRQHALALETAQARAGVGSRQQRRGEGRAGRRIRQFPGGIGVHDHIQGQAVRDRCGTVARRQHAQAGGAPQERGPGQPAQPRTGGTHLGVHATGQHVAVRGVHHAGAGSGKAFAHFHDTLVLEQDIGPAHAVMAHHKTTLYQSTHDPDLAVTGRVPWRRRRSSVLWP